MRDQPQWYGLAEALLLDQKVFASTRSGSTARARVLPDSWANYFLHPWHIDVSMIAVRPGLAIYNPDEPISDKRNRRAVQAQRLGVDRQQRARASIIRIVSMFSVTRWAGHPGFQ